jgi:hypothetical protein
VSKLDSAQTESLTHDINSTLSSLLSALEVVNDEWKTNPALVDKILPLTTHKLELLQEQMRLYRNNSQN